MKFAASLLASVALVQGAKISSETQVDASATAVDNSYISGQSYPTGYNYYSHPGYQYPDNHIEHSGEELPTADFNHQVWDFDHNKDIWDQNDYEERVKVEAELLVALEALKGFIAGISYDISHIADHIGSQYAQIGLNHQEAFNNMEALIGEFSAVW